MNDVINFSKDWAVYFAIVFGAIYLAGSLMIWDYDISTWTDPARPIAVCVALVVSFFITMFNFELGYNG